MLILFSFNTKDNLQHRCFVNFKDIIVKRCFKYSIIDGEHLTGE